jgi:hypothetical protein
MVRRADLPPVADTSDRWLKRGLLVLAGGLVCYALLLSWQHLRKYTLVDMPVYLEKGRVYQQSFEPSTTAHYDVEIAAQQKLPRDVLECLLGTSGTKMRSYPVGCDANRSTLNVFWQITEQGRTVATSGSKNIGALLAQNETSKVWHEFQLSAGKAYVITLTVLTDGGRLNVANPKLRMRMSDLDYKDEYIVAGIVRLLCLGIAFAGFWMAGVAGLFMLRRRSFSR